MSVTTECLQHYATLALSDIDYTDILVIENLRRMRFDVYARQGTKVLATSYINYEHINLGPDMITKLVLNTTRNNNE